MTQTFYGDRCEGCGEAYTPFALRTSSRTRNGGFSLVQCRCEQFGGEAEVPVYNQEGTSAPKVVDEVPLYVDRRSA